MGNRRYFQIKKKKEKDPLIVYACRIMMLQKFGDSYKSDLAFWCLQKNDLEC